MAGEFTKQTPYTHLCHLAQGGMGTVSLALRREGDFQRIYALKRLHPLVRDDAELRAMFLDEARIAGIIRHPNVVSVLDMGEDAEGPFLVMDYVDGLNLAQLIVDAKKQGELLPIQVAVRVALAVARGLHAAHEQVDHDGRPLAIVHRDLSPQNVLIGYAGTVSITDFGIAKALGRSAKTSTGVLKGKISYMSPEQLRFEEPDRRSDLFALGVILFEMLSGKRLYPHKGGNDVPRRILHEAPPDIGEFRPEVPPELVQLIFRLLAKSPDARPKSAAVAAQQLEGILASLLAEEDPIDLGPYVRDITGDRQTERRREIADLIAGAAVDDKDTIEFPLQQRLRSAASETVEPPRTKRRSRLALLGVIVVVLGVGVVALALVVPSADVRGYANRGSIGRRGGCHCRRATDRRRCRFRRATDRRGRAAGFRCPTRHLALDAQAPPAAIDERRDGDVELRRAASLAVVAASGYRARRPKIRSLRCASCDSTTRAATLAAPSSSRFSSASSS
jgi:serine/threonine protein kinase